MNFYKSLSYLAIVALALLTAITSSLLFNISDELQFTSDVRNGVAVLLFVVLLLIFFVLILFCLSNAKERLKERKEQYKKAHIENKLDAILERGTGIGEKLAEHYDIPRVSCKGICDVLVRKKFPRKCQEIPIKITRRPDPCIYSQFFLMDAGQPVTWDNPDVKIELGGIEQDTYNLLADTEYDVTVFAKNSSPFFDSLGTQIRVNQLDFGIGGINPTLLHTFSKDIPAGTLDHSIPETFKWTTPSTAGHYCLQVLITHGNDVNPNNNEGWNNTEVRKVAAGELVSRTFPLWNNIVFDLPGREKRNATFRKLHSEISVDLSSYVLPQIDPGITSPETIFQNIPPKWDATVSPNRFSLETRSKQNTELTFQVQVPDDAAVGTASVFNVTAYAGNRPLGGVYFRLEVS